MKRSRGRGRKSTNFNNRTLDSSGPDVKIRGSASHIFEKYQALARDANSSGNRIGAENLLQHAEHYFRVMRAAQANSAANTAANANANAKGAPGAEEAANGQGANGALDDEPQPQASANGNASQEAAPKTARRRKGRRPPPANGKSRKSSDSDKGESSADTTEEASA